MTKSKTIGIISIKGGVGKTTTSINLAYSLANDYGKKVLLVDTNFSSPNIALHLGNSYVKQGIREVLNNNIKPSSAIYEHEFGFHVLPATITMTGNNFTRLKTKISSLKKDYDVILLDSSPSLNSELAATIAASDELYVISTPDLPTLGTTLKAVKIAKDKKMQINGMILNKYRGKNYELKPAEMERLSGVPLVGVVKDNVKVLEALSKVQPVTMLSPHSDVAIEYKKIAAKLIGAIFEEPKWHEKLKAAIKDDFGNLITHKFSNGFKYYK